MTGNLAERLRREWQRDIRSFGCAGSDGDEAFDDLLDRYREPHRRYHDLEHVASVQRWVDALADAERVELDLSAVRLAAWYHDVVHDPGAHDNQARSAMLAAVTLAGLGIPSAVTERCASLIEMTATHQLHGPDAGAAVLLDADLAVLGGSPARYLRYRESLRAENGHLAEATFAQERREALLSMLDRPSIFNTVTFRAEREPRARANLTRELEDLASAAGAVRS